MYKNGSNFLRFCIICTISNSIDYNIVIVMPANNHAVDAETIDNKKKYSNTSTS